MNETLAKIYLVRHGQTAWSMSGQHTGHTDLPLNEQGESDAGRLNSVLTDVHFARVFASPLQRAWRTAELAGFGAVVQSDPDLMEWDYGQYEGRRTADIRAERPNWRLFIDGCPSGETLAQVSERAERVVKRVRAQAGDVLVFAHADILRVIIARWLDLPAEAARHFYLMTATLTILGYDHDIDEPIIRLLNLDPAIGRVT